jgi:hypothetical protein
MQVDDRDEVCISPCDDSSSEDILMKPRRTSIVHVPTGVLGMDRRVLSPLADGIYLALLHTAKPHLQKQDLHRLRLSDLARAVGFKSRNVFHLKKTLREMAETSVEWDLLRRKDCWGSCKLFERMEIRRDAAGLVVEYAYGSRLKKLLDSVPFAEINLKALREIRGKYDRRLYLIVRSAEYKGSLTLKIENLRHVLGVPDSAHPTWAGLRRMVILPAVDTVNKISDLRISFDANNDKDTREPASVIFCVKKVSEIQGHALPKRKAGNDSAALWRAMSVLRAEIAELKQNRRRK